MIRSMTGFGKGIAQNVYGTIIVEIKTLNHRFLEVTNKLPNHFVIFDDKIRSYVAKRIKRGKATVALSYGGREESAEMLSIDARLARRYYALLAKLKRGLQLKGDIELSHILAFPNVITYETAKRDVGKMWPLVKRALDGALNTLVSSRRAEGKSISSDLTKRIRKIESTLLTIKHRAPLVVEQYKKRLNSQLKDLSQGEAADEKKVELEAAIFARNSDVTEEIVRMCSHIKSFRVALAKKEAVGRELDFIAQELHREATTIGSKAADYKTSGGVIKLKSEIEKIREQLQNVE